MSKRIVEEAPQKGSHAQGADKLQKQASQLAYDVKYKVKQSLGKDTKLNPAQVAKAYLTQLAKSPAPPAVKSLAKKKLMGEEYTSDVASLAEKAMVNAMVKVFVEGVSVEHVEVEQIQEEEKQYKIRVTDKKTGNTYVRNATRAKIAELRANPNISSVEMTGYGEISGDEKSKGAKTAKAKAGKGLDPVGQEDKDVDNDGDHDKSDKYLLKRRKAVGKAIATRKEELELTEKKREETHIGGGNLKKLAGKATKRIDADVDGDVDKNDPKAGDYGEFVPSPDGKKRVYTKIKEDFISEVKEKEEDKDKKLDIRKGVKNKVKVFPEVKEQVEEKPKRVDPAQKRAQMQKVNLLQRKIQAIRSGGGSDIMASYNAKGKVVEETGKKGCSCEKTPCECDEREIPTKMDLVKNKMRAKGIKVSSITPAPRNMKTADELGEATYPSDFINPDGSKRAVAKKKTGRPIQHDQPTSGGRRKTVDE